MARVTSPAAEALLDREVPVLDHGFVRLVDYLGGDERIVQAARVSYGPGTKTVRQDAALIDYLLRHDHTSPFEQVVLTFHLKMPIFVARQWVRHRTARMNEISGRYSVMADEFYVPPDELVQFQSADNKQARDPIAPVPPEVRAEVRRTLAEDQRRLYASYERMLAQGIARELARVGLPLSLYTQFYWQIDLHNLFHFVRLRADPHAQAEIRLYAEAVAGAARAVAPKASAAFEKHVLRGCRLSRDEIAAVRRLVSGQEAGLAPRAEAELREKLGF